MKDKNLKVIDFFCGAGGMSYGLSQAGIRVLGGIDQDTDCKATYEQNIENARYLQHDITTLSERSLSDYFAIKRNDDQVIFCGCSPCQFWSKVPTNRTKSKQTAFLLQHFERFISYFRPGYVVVENVPGLKRKDRSILPQFLKFLTEQGYSYSDGVVNANHYGVPQHRRRYLLIATRLRDQVSLPLPYKRAEALTVRKAIGEKSRLPLLSAGELDRKDPLHRAAVLSEQNLKRIKKTPPNGGDRRSWSGNTALQLDAYKGDDNIFADVYGRMHWDRPAPTITTRFNSLSNGRFGHPEQHRAISLREGAILQTFPRKFRFIGSNIASIARQIGNAVPPKMAQRVGLHIKWLANHG